MVVGIMEYAAKELVGVMSMDMAYFEQTAPVIKDITNIILALGWGMLIANMVFQSTKAMMSGVGFESEDPKHIFCRTFVFAFLLLASKQICNLAMGITGNVIELLQIPSALDFSIPDQSMFDISSSVKWLIVIVVGFILIFQYIKLLFEIGERYVVTSVLTFFSPLAFAMGGSKNTNDIFKGWCRMYGSMMVMMIMNIVFLKLILSAMGNVTKGSVLIWLVFVVALTRVARKIDSHIGKIGLNPAQTGDGVGSRLPGMMTMVAVRTMASTIGRNISSNRDSVGIIHEVTEVTQIIIPNIHARRAVLPEVMQEQQLIHHRAIAHQAVNKQETVNLYRITAVNQTDNTEEKINTEYRIWTLMNNTENSLTVILKHIRDVAV